MSTFPIASTRCALFVAIGAVLAGCTVSTGLGDWEDLCSNGNEPVGSIRFKPAAPSVRVGEEVYVETEVLKPDGSLVVLCVDAPTLSIADATVAAVVGGRVRGIAVGQTTMLASTGGKTMTAVITVTSDALAQLDATVSHATLLVGQVTRVSATARDFSGNAVTLQSTAWSSESPAIASVSANGTVVARGVGTATFSLTSGGKTASTFLSITTGPPTIRMADISAGGNQSCALAATGTSTPAGTAFCWGAGVTSNGSVQHSPARVPGNLTFRSISAGNLLSCGISTAGATYCWGWNTSGELGVGNRTANPSPQRVSGSATYRSVVAADQLACGLLSTGRAACWGASHLSDAILVPTPVAGALTFVDLTSGTGGPGGVCGRTASGAVYCWSRVSRWNVVAPALASGSSTFTSVTVGGLYNCGLMASGGASCWGQISDQLGAGVGAGTFGTPAPMPGGLIFQSIAAAGSFFCGITDSGTWCHGPTGLRNSTAGSTLPRLVPMLDPQTLFVRIAGGSRHACALDTRGAVWCWGESPFLGLLDISRPSEPLQIRFE
ncbi:Ig-like domain-containing protein [Gemmatimonas sp.]|uniref:Ig-like domain-containing protein n=1 Tax=Gemmatimonas sp. TaxID=1962908 RepID=UPI0039837F3A